MGKITTAPNRLRLRFGVLQMDDGSSVEEYLCSALYSHLHDVCVAGKPADVCVIRREALDKLLADSRELQERKSQEELAKAFSNEAFSIAA